MTRADVIEVFGWILIFVCASLLIGWWVILLGVGVGLVQGAKGST